MDLSRVAVELRGPVRRVPPLPLQSRLSLRLLRAGSARVPAARADGVSVEDVEAARPLRLYRPRLDPSPAALLWIHGGGFVLGSPRQDDAHCVAVAARLGVTVVSVGYRLAPDHPFPAASDDCRSAWMWLVDNAPRLGIDPARIAVGGASAGGGLAACLAQRLVSTGEPTPAVQWLAAPMLDDRTAARSDLDAVGHRVWDNRKNRFGWRAYLGVEPGAPTVPAFSVAGRREDLRGLPPTWIGVGDIDLFHDEDLTYADRLRDAGVDVTVEVVPGAPHGFESWGASSDLARQHCTRARAWLADALGLPARDKAATSAG